MSSSRRGADHGEGFADDVDSVGTGAPVSLTVPAGARSALITAIGGDLRYRFASAPTTAVGHLLPDGGNIEVMLYDLPSVQFISTTGTVTLFVTYFKTK